MHFIVPHNILALINAFAARALACAFDCDTRAYANWNWVLRMSTHTQSAVLHAVFHLRIDLFSSVNRAHNAVQVAMYCIMSRTTKSQFLLEIKSSLGITVFASYDRVRCTGTDPPDTPSTCRHSILLMCAVRIWTGQTTYPMTVCVWGLKCGAMLHSDFGHCSTRSQQQQTLLISPRDFSGRRQSA